MKHDYAVVLSLNINNDRSFDIDMVKIFPGECCVTTRERDFSARLTVAEVQNDVKYL